MKMCEEFAISTKPRIQGVLHILSQPSGDFDPEAHPELKIPPDRSGENFRKHHLLILTKNIKNLFHEVPRNDPELPTLDPERNFKNPGS